MIPVAQIGTSSRKIDAHFSYTNITIVFSVDNPITFSAICECD